MTKGGEKTPKVGLKNFFITKISKTFDFMGQKSKKNVRFSVLLYGITPLPLHFSGTLYYCTAAVEYSIILRVPMLLNKFLFYCVFLTF